jgi:hypothetical protein
MPYLTWTFDWSAGRAETRPSHGVYVVQRQAPGRWSAIFTRVETEPYRRTARAVDKQQETFSSMADAMRACQRHADTYRPDASNRLKSITPLPH